MKMKISRLSLLVFVYCSTFFLRSIAVPSKELLGVAPGDENYYKGLSSGTIQCKDGSKTFTKSQLNDDFCDCLDGTDEPGTSACPTGKFYCRNAGHIPLSIFSSRVNDGICDCCDGSDEYNGKIKCKNTCWEAGKVARDRLLKKIATFKEGVEIRKRDVEQAKLLAEKDAAELSKLKSEEKILKGLVEQLKDRKELIEKAEEKERKEKEEKQKKEAEEAKLKAPKAEEKVVVAEEEPGRSDNDDKVGLLDDSQLDQDPKTIPDPAVESLDNIENDMKHAETKEEASEVAHESDSHTVSGSKVEDASQETDSLSREELGRAIGSRWTGKKSEHHNENADNAKDNDNKNDDEISDDAHYEEYNGYDTETEEDHPSYEDDDTEENLEDVEEEAHDDSSSSYESDGEVDMSDMERSNNPSWLKKIQQSVKKFLQAVNPFQTPVDTSGEAANVRKEYDEASGKLSKIQSRISSLTKKLGHDLGPEKEFYSLYGQCFESKQNKYVYKVCPFKEASQVEGHSTTRLGQWEKFEESYRVMHFSNGDKCWNGPDRSLKVRLRCGLKVELTDVDEPSRCEYSALLTTPALCLEGKLKELQDKLEAMNKEQPQGHDEL